MGTASLDVKEWVGGVGVSTEGHNGMMAVYHRWSTAPVVGSGEQEAVGTRVHEAVGSGECETCTMGGE